MKLNKTLEMMREINEKENSSMTIYGRKQLDKILNFKAVASCETNGSELTFKLTDGSEIYANYSEIEN